MKVNGLDIGVCFRAVCLWDRPLVVVPFQMVFEL